MIAALVLATAAAALVLLEHAAAATAGSTTAAAATEATASAAATAEAAATTTAAAEAAASTTTAAFASGSEAATATATAFTARSESTTTAPATAEATTTAATALLAWTRLVDGERTTIEVLAVERLHGGPTGLVVHFDETETTRATGLPVGHEMDAMNLAVRREDVADLVLGGRERKVPDVDADHDSRNPIGLTPR